MNHGLVCTEVLYVPRSCMNHGLECTEVLYSKIKLIIQDL